MSASSFDDFILGCANDCVNGSSGSFPEPEQWNGQDDRPMPSVENDDARERDANWLLTDMTEFKKNYGLPALIRLLAELA